MRDPLDISFPSTVSYSIYPSEELRKRGEELLSLTSLRQRLLFYNKHICSLCYSYPTEGLFSYGKYTDGHSHGTLFFRKEGRGNTEDFEVFLQERQKEIDRLKKLVWQQSSYYGKLKCFIEQTAGQTRFDELIVETNDWTKFAADGAGTVPEHLLDHRPEIDLQPRSPEEIKGYNKYLREYVKQLMNDSEKPHWLVEEKYQGFLALPAMESIRKQVKRALNREATVKAELDRIEFTYHSIANYTDFLYPYDSNDFSRWQSALFNAMIHGHQFDYTRKKLSVQEMKALIHVEQVYIYYKYVHVLKKDIVYGSFHELFEDEVKNGVLSELKNKKMLAINEALFDYLFSGWLQKQRGWEYGDACGYQMYLTKGEFKEFLKEYKAEEQTRAFLVGNTVEEANQIYQKNFEAKREWFRIKRKATKKDCEQIPGLEEGDSITQDPSYSTSSEAFALLTNYYAPQYMELEKLFFTEKYKTWNEMTVRAEMAEIESFMNNADKLSLSDACRVFNKWGQDTNEFVFLRLKSGFYENLEVSNYPFIGSIGNKEAQIYGRYFLFYGFLKAQLTALGEMPSDGHAEVRTQEKGIAEADPATSNAPDVDLANIRNNFDHVVIKDVYNHFKMGLVKKGFLSDPELRRYLKFAFDQRQVPNPRFKFTNSPTKKHIMGVFYRYYTELASKPYGKQEHYAALLGGYFESYRTETVKTNFNKT